VADDALLCLLLLDGVLEDVPFERRARDLMRARAVVALEPSRRSAGFLAGGVARRVSKRLPGMPRVLVLVGPRQYPLARALIARHPGCELWYAPGPGTDDDLARQRAALLFDAADRPAAAAFQANAELWDRLEELGIAAR
jgi:hypothetical protein